MKNLPFIWWVGFEFVIVGIELCWDWDGLNDGFWFGRIRPKVTEFSGLGFSKCLSEQKKEDFFMVFWIWGEYSYFLFKWLIFQV